MQTPATKRKRPAKAPHPNDKLRWVSRLPDSRQVANTAFWLVNWHKEVAMYEALREAFHTRNRRATIGHGDALVSGLWFAMENAHRQVLIATTRLTKYGGLLFAWAGTTAIPAECLS